MDKGDESTRDSDCLVGVTGCFVEGLGGVGVCAGARIFGVVGRGDVEGGGEIFGRPSASGEGMVLFTLLRAINFDFRAVMGFGD